MRAHLIVALVTSLALTGGLLLLAGEADGKEIENVEAVLRTPNQTTTTTTALPRVLHESSLTIAPDTDLYGNPVGDHYGETTTTSTVPAPATAKPVKTSSKTSAPKPTTTTTTAPPTPAFEPHFDPRAESSFASRINGLRAASGLAALTRSGSLDAEARSWAKIMAERGQLSHSNIGRLVPPWSAAGENVGTGGTVDSLFTALTGSSGHRSNMLGDFTHLGVGVWVDQNGRIWTVHLFAR